MPFNITIRWPTQPESARTRTVWVNAGGPAIRHMQAMRVLRARWRFIVESRWEVTCAAAKRIALKLRATRSPAQGRWTKSVPRQGHNTSLPLRSEERRVGKQWLGGRAFRASETR